MEGVIAIICIFIILPGMLFHYITKWKQNAPSLTTEDEGLLDDMYNTARRLEERLHTIERIVAADNPDYLPRDQRPEQIGQDGDYREMSRLEDRNTTSERI